jgi:hypothetical protein
MSPIDTARVAEVIVGHDDYGSGYRISSLLVLTTAHLFPPGDGACVVRLGGGDTSVPGTRVWRGNGHDLALIRLSHDTVTDTVPPVALGRLSTGVGRVPFTAVGFPAFAQRPASPGVIGLRRRDSRQVDGFIQLGSNLKSGLLDLSFSTSPPLPEAAGMPDPWLGISGAAVFVSVRGNGSGLLVGVQGSRLPAAGTGSAEAEAVSEALRDPDFVDHLVRDGVRPQPIPVDAPGQPSSPCCGP